MNRATFVNQLDRRALTEARNLKNCQARLISLFQQLDEHKAYLELGYPSLFAYAVGRLKLSEDQVCDLTSVARCSKRIPQLKAALSTGQLTVSRARRLVPVLTKENQQNWIEFASGSTHRQLERKIADTKPQAVERKILRATTKGRSQLVVGVSREIGQNVDRCGELVGGDLEAAIGAMSELYLKYKDPLRKALRKKAKQAVALKKAKSSGTQRAPRKPLPAKVQHQVNLRDLRRCQFPGCQSTRYIEIHHLIPLSKGGPSTVSNLVSLCGAHHKHIHDTKMDNNSMPRPEDPVIQHLMQLARTRRSSIKEESAAGLEKI